jgi:putative copper resistance protein D
LAAALSGAAVTLLAAAGHAVALEGGDRYVMLSVQAVHLLAAGIWLGGLIPLALSVAILPPRLAGIVALSFSRIGIACVTALVLTAWVNGYIFVGDVSALLGTEYGRWMLVKLTLLVAMLGFAVANRFKYTPALSRPGGSNVAGRFRVWIALEAWLGLLALLAAGILVATPPGVHAMRETAPHLH